MRTKIFVLYSKTKTNLKNKNNIMENFGNREQDFQTKNNSELVAIFGNFINRVVVLTNKYYNGIVPTPNDFSEIDEDVLAAVKEFPNTIGKSIERYRFREASQELMNLARLGNKYLADEEPWKVIKLDEKRVQTILYVALQISTALAVVSEPFLPFTSIKLKNILNVDEKLSWAAVTDAPILLPSNHQISKAELLFSKIEDKAIEAQIEKLASGFNKTESGLRYQILQQGEGKKAHKNDIVSVHYKGQLADGTVFDSSYKRNDPIEFTLGVGQVIAGWDEGIALLHVGEKARFVIPSALAYGSQGAGGVIPPNANLIFDVELVAIK
mgnify:CR=1 FL=1